MNGGFRIQELILDLRARLCGIEGEEMRNVGKCTATGAAIVSQRVTFVVCFVSRLLV